MRSPLKPNALAWKIGLWCTASGLVILLVFFPKFPTQKRQTSFDTKIATHTERIKQLSQPDISTQGSLGNIVLLEALKKGIQQAQSEGHMPGLSKIKRATPSLYAAPVLLPSSPFRFWVEKWILTDISQAQAEIYIRCEETPTGANWALGNYKLYPLDTPYELPYTAGYGNP